MDFKRSSLLMACALFAVMPSVDGRNPYYLAFPAAHAEETFSCTKMLWEWRREMQQKRKYAAFARGRAFTITGMKGCGYSWGQKTQATADKKAMSECRRYALNSDKCYISDRTK